MNRPAWWWRWFGYVLATPNTLIGVLLALWYRSHSWRWSAGCIECIGGRKDGRTRIWGKPGAQTHGWLIVYAGARRRARSDLRVHERVHVAQAMVGSLAYLAAYGLHFAWRYVRNAAYAEWPSTIPRWRRAYRGICFEEQAYRIEAEFAAGKRPNAWGAR